MNLKAANEALAARWAAYTKQEAEAVAGRPCAYCDATPATHGQFHMHRPPSGLGYISGWASFTAQGGAR